jgi:hypothetical protein
VLRSSPEILKSLKIENDIFKKRDENDIPFKEFSVPKNLYSFRGNREPGTGNREPGTENREAIPMRVTWGQ